MGENNTKNHIHVLPLPVPVHQFNRLCSRKLSTRFFSQPCIWIDMVLLRERESQRECSIKLCPYMQMHADSIRSAWVQSWENPTARNFQIRIWCCVAYQGNSVSRNVCEAQSVHLVLSLCETSRNFRFLTNLFTHVKERRKRWKDKLPFSTLNLGL